jgi:hypothetical protein
LLVLPLRCVDSKHVGGTAGFDTLLRGLGLTELLPRRLTPRLVFYILGNKDVPELLSLEEGTSWTSRVQATVKGCISEEAASFFSKDFSTVSPTEFSVSLPKEFLSLRTKKIKRGVRGT